MSEPSTARRWVALGLTTACVGALIAYFVLASVAIQSLHFARSAALLALGNAEASAPVRALSPSTVRRAIEARPIDAGLANVAMSRDVHANGMERARQWISVISQLGWRDTATLQNRMLVAADNADFVQLLDLTEALMRRHKVEEQAIAVLIAVESEPTMRGALVDRLAKNPTWRLRYLTSTGELATTDQLKTRFQVLQELRRRGAPPVSDEIEANTRALDRGGLHELSFALWASGKRGVERPLNDTDFADASVSSNRDESTAPFEWQLLSGPGYDADAYKENGRTSLALDWDGRGVPVLVQQRTSAQPGRYELAVQAAPEDAAELKALTFKLVCEKKAISLKPAGRRPDLLVTDVAVPCAFPVLQIAGDVQGSATPHQLVIYGLALRPLPGARKAL